MKTRLLNKVRKRYTITKIDALASNASDFYRAVKEEYGVPFYVLDDAQDGFGRRTKYFKTFDESREILCKWISSDYWEKFKHKEEKSSNVWWYGK